MARYHIRFFTFATAVLSLASCRPDKNVQPVDIIEETEMPPIQRPIMDNVYGAMSSIKLRTVIEGQETNAEMASAVFFNEPSNTATATEGTAAGHVLINNINLNQSAQNGYDRTAVEGQIINNLNYDNGVTWTIGGEDGIPPVTFTWSQYFPEYNGSFPVAINRKENLSFTFDESTLKYTDSVFVAIAAGSKLIVKRYSSHAGTVTVSSDELAQLQMCPPSMPGYLQVSASLVDIFFLLNGNPVALIKQQTDIRTIVIY